MSKNKQHQHKHHKKRILHVSYARPDHHQELTLNQNQKDANQNNSDPNPDPPDPYEYVLKEGDLDVKIFLPKEELKSDLETLKQIRTMSKHPSMKHVRVMPDCHRGIGCCVGFTSYLVDKIVPNYIGGDIGCGILTYPIGPLTTKKKLTQIEKRIREIIPFDGNKIKSNLHDYPVIQSQDFAYLFGQADDVATSFTEAYQEKFQIDLSNHQPTYNKEWYLNLLQKTGADQKYIERTYGTLGGGNHFVEIDSDPETDQDYITIHSGSRSLGQKVNQYHQNKINQNCKIDFREWQKRAKPLTRKIRDRKERKRVEDELTREMSKNLHSKYLETEEMYEYFFDMIFTQVVAQLNRRIMLREFLEQYHIPYDPTKIIESVHNYIDFRDLIWRKGAIAAHQDQPCVIALNMRDGILICRGKGNPDWNYSSAHGAGRLYNREKAFRKGNMKRFKEQMKEVYSTTVSLETLDEGPDAYKDTELIKAALENSVEIIAHLKPVINVKGSNN